MNAILNLIKPAAPATPAAAALAAHKAKREKLATLQQQLGKVDTADSQTIAAKQTADALAEARRQLRLDLLAAAALGANNAAKIATCDNYIAERKAHADELTEAAEIAQRKRAIIAPQIKQLSDDIRALEADWPRVQRDVLLERIALAAPAFKQAQDAYFKQWTAVWGLALAADRLQVAGAAPLHASHVVQDFVMPLPLVKEVRAVDIIRDDLFQSIAVQAARVTEELAE